MIGFAELVELTGSKEPAKVESYAHQIRLAGEHMLALVNDLLDLGRAAVGGLGLKLQALPLRAATEEAVDLLRGLANTHRLSMQVNIDDSVMVMADKSRLHQVLLNLGSNAIKYNRSGGSVRFLLHPSESGLVGMTVEDTGIRMTPAQASRLFQPFDRLGLDRTPIPGAGLGLVISRSLIEEMEGSLSAHSTPQEGTRVRIQLRQSA